MITFPMWHSGSWKMLGIANGKDEVYGRGMYTMINLEVVVCGNWVGFLWHLEFLQENIRTSIYLLSSFIERSETSDKMRTTQEGRSHWEGISTKFIRVSGWWVLCMICVHVKTLKASRSQNWFEIPFNLTPFGIPKTEGLVGHLHETIPNHWRKFTICWSPIK